jgi:RNA polymerase sigma factor (sigma-70 family)
VTAPFALGRSADRSRDTRERDFRIAVEPLMPDLLAYFARRVTPRDDAADCLSETLLVLWRKRRAIPGNRDELRAWAFGIARNVLANHVRGRVRRSALAERVRAEIRVSVEVEPLGMELLDVLQPDDRELVRLIIWDGFGVAEAGSLLGIRPGAARMRFSRAKDRLRHALVADD